MRILTESIVVRASAHNPSILHPSFLEAKGIVPPAWATSEPPICTPPFSVVKFKSGVVFLVDSETLQVSQAPGHNNPSEFDVPHCVQKYIKSLPDVPYTALGINFDALVDCDEPEQFLIKNFLCPGKWNDGNQLLAALSIKLVYMKDKWRLTISLEPWPILKTRESIKGIAVSGNYHLDLSSDDHLLETINAIDAFYRQRDDFEGFVRSILTIEED